MKPPTTVPGWAILLAVACVGAGTVAPARVAHTASAAINNPALLAGLTAAQQAAIGRNGFVVTAPVGYPPTAALENQVEPDSTHRPNSPSLELQHAVYWQFSDLLADNYGAQIPSLITADTLLHSFHVIYDQTLVALERTVFAAKLRALNAGLFDTSAFQFSSARDSQTKEAARLNLGYAAVAQRLLDPTATIPAGVAPAVRAELALIAAHHGTANSPLFGQPVDYSQFVPRGHYTGSESLRRYFLAMTWYGRLSFPLEGPDAALRARQALLLVRSLTLVPELGRAWAAVFDPITTWVGRSDDLTVRDYQAIAVRVYGAKAPVAALADPAKLATFIRMATALPGPQIRDEGGLARSFRLFGQRFVPDAAIMQELIFPHVGSASLRRDWPSGLDVAATLGSARANTLQRASQGRYPNYAQALAAQQARYGALPAGTWGQNLYWGWLDMLRAAWGRVPAAAPAFMHSEAYAAKQLATGLGSWAELRHDTLLYVKQPSGLGAGGPQPVPVAYVEPVPLVYIRLQALTAQLKATLERAGLLDALPSIQGSIYLGSGVFAAVPQAEKGYRAAIDAFAAVVTLAEATAERELQGEPVSANDTRNLYLLGGDLGQLERFFQDNANGRSLTPFERQVALVADVFTEPRSGQVLEVGVGDVLPMFAVVTVNGKRWLARGGTYSYYEFRQPMANRLTDDTWRHLPRRPALPSWSGSYLAG